MYAKLPSGFKCKLWLLFVDNFDQSTFISDFVIAEGVVGSEVLHLGRDLGFGDAEGHRVTQVRKMSSKECAFL